MKSLQLLVFILIFIFFPGCLTTQAYLTAVTTKDVNLEGLNLDALPGNFIEGTTEAFVLLFVPFGKPHINDAVNDALSKGGGDLILNATIFTQRKGFFIGKNIIRIKGKVVNTQGSDLK
jgi:hypothetical protein